MPAAVEAIRKKIKAGNPGMKESSTFAIANVVRKRQLGIPIRKHVTEEKLANLNKVGSSCQDSPIAREEILQKDPSRADKR